MPARFGRREFLRVAGAAACSLAVDGRRWARAAPRPMPDVVVLLPGILGSVLRKDGRDVWALSPSGVIEALRTLGRSIDALTLKHDSADLEDLGDGVTADRLFPDVHLVPGLWKIDGYTKIAESIQREFAVRPGENFFTFPYDWRRDIRVAARRLEKESRRWLAAWRGAGHVDAKLVLVGHSMGGLVARYFLECLGGWPDTRMLISFGTPYRGSLNALDFLANGFKKRLAGIEIVDLTELLRSFTSVYQLLPIYPCYEADGALVRVGETTGIPGVDPSRAAAALAFHREIERAVEDHRRDVAYLRGGYTIHPIVGTYQQTLQSARRDGNRVEMLRTYPGRDYDGDGTVPRPSATPIELDAKGTEMFVAEVHGSLQNATPVLEQLAGLLRRDESALRGMVPDTRRTRVSLTLDDAYATGEPILIRSRCDDKTARLDAVLVDVQTGRPVARPPMQRVGDDAHEGECPPLPEGTYRVTVGAADAAASDVFIVAGRA